ncbi:MAG: hypothetical protein RIS64_2289 [Bacteroidota bacterium]|jgi:hypothetical protein
MQILVGSFLRKKMGYLISMNETAHFLISIKKSYFRNKTVRVTPLGNVNNA